MTTPKRKFIIISDYGLLMDVADHLANVEGHEVLMHVSDNNCKEIGDGIVEKIDDWYRYLGEGYTWIFEGCKSGDIQDWLRSKGESVFGSSALAAKLEENRQINQKWFKALGFHQPFSKNFKDIGEAIKFVNQHRDKRWILKQNGDAPKSISHMGKFDGGEDMIFHLEQLRKKWNEQAFGKFDCDLMEVVEGLEVAASGFFNGEDWMRDKDGKVVGFLSFEEKKESDGGMGETTWEAGTTFIGVTEENPIFKSILMRDGILEELRATKMRGVFDINCISTKEGMVALEPTCRPGIPSTSYEFLAAMKSGTGEMIYAVAAGEKTPLDVQMGVGMVIYLLAKPFPLESESIEDENTSLGEKLWILKDGKPADDFDEEQRKRIHLYNFKRTDDDYLVASKLGYLLTVTGIGKDIQEARESIVEYMKENLYLSGMKWRTDIGQRVDDHYGISPRDKMKEEYEEKLKAKDGEIGEIKQALKEAIYGTES